MQQEERRKKKIKRKYVIEMKAEESLMNSELKLKILIMGVSLFCVTSKCPPVLRSNEFDMVFNFLAINRHLLLSVLTILLCMCMH